MNKRSITFAKKPLAVGVASALFALSMAPVNAASWSLGDVNITFDSTFSYGGSWRTENRNLNTISKANNPVLDWTGYGYNLANQAAPFNSVYTSADVWENSGSYSSNGDAGNLNFDRGDMFSSLLKGSHELSIAGENIGFFSRFMYFYDFALNDLNSDHPKKNSCNHNYPSKKKKKTLPPLGQLLQGSTVFQRQSGPRG